jgi:hypothetical protein
VRGSAIGHEIEIVWEICRRKNAPPDLSIAKAQAAWWHVFEVKYTEYTLFNSIALEHMTADQNALNANSPLYIEPMSTSEMDTRNISDREWSQKVDRRGIHCRCVSTLAGGHWPHR